MFTGAYGSSYASVSSSRFRNGKAEGKEGTIPMG